MNGYAGNNILARGLIIVGLLWCFSVHGFADDQTQTARPALRMTVDDLELTIANLDENYSREGGVISFGFEGIKIQVVTDEKADRMRIIIPILEADQLNEPMLYRIMQANFDSSLDARYAIAQGVLWSTFIHRLSSLTETDFLSGIGQTMNTATSFGSSFSSGELIYGGGDSNSIQQRQLIDQLQKKGRAI